MTPIEMYQLSGVGKRQLFKMIRLIWKTETTPDKFLEGVFCPIWKHKGTTIRTLSTPTDSYAC